MRSSPAPTLGLAACLGLAVAPALAIAHVAPAVGDNNRYMKLTAQGDRIRLAYTVFYGEAPAAALRQAIDTNHDGAIDDAESQVFARQIAADVAAALVITIDGAPRPVAWSQVVVGLATPKVAAGAFSIDLVASLCLTVPRGAHAVVFRDHYPLARPGETQVKVEDSPGVTITTSRIGGAVDEAHDYTLVGPSGALDTEGLELTFTTTDRAAVAADGACAGPAPPGSPTGLISLISQISQISQISVIAGAAVAGLVALTVRRRMRRRGGRARRSGPQPLQPM